MRWPEVALGDVVTTFDSMRVPVKESERRPGPYPYYGASGVVDHVDEFIFDGDYLLVAEDGENLRTRKTPIAFMAKGRFWVNNHAHIVQANSRADTRFLCYALSVADVAAYLTGSTMPKLTQGNLSRVPVCLPPRSEQRAIAAVLGALDDKIDLNERLGETLEETARALFKSWFVDFDPVRAKAAGRQPFGMDAATAALFPSRFDDSELGQVPTGWHVAPLAAASASIRRGVGPAYTDAGGVLVLNQKCVRDHRVGFDAARRHDPARRAVDDRLLAPGDVLVNSTGIGTLGRVAPVLRLPEPAIVDSHVTVVRADAIVYRPELLSQLLILREPEIEALGEGSTGQTELSRERLGQLGLVLPPMAIQQRAAAVLAPLDARRAALQVESEQLTALRDYLLPKLLSGEVRVLDAEKLVSDVA